MALPRATWKGYLKLSLVSCPVRLYPAATESNRIAFHLLHKDTHNRIRMQPRDPELGDVDRADLVKGYEYEKDKYVILTDEDFAKVRIESTDTITIDSFVDAKEVDQLYLNASYYLSPDGGVAEETFRVIHQAMRQRNKAALSRVVMGGRERMLALSVRDKGFVATTLRTAEEVRDYRLYFENIRDGKLEKDMLDLAGQLIDQKTAHFDPKAFRDRYEEAVIELVKAKVKGQEPVIAKAPERGKVINLMDALRQSLARSEAAKQQPTATEGRRASTTKARGREKKAQSG